MADELPDITVDPAGELGAGWVWGTAPDSGGQPSPAPPRSFGTGLRDFAKGLFTGTQDGKESTPSPLSAFSSLLGLGATGLSFANQSRALSQMKGQEQLIKRGQQQAQAAAAPAIAAGTTDIQRAQAGKLQPAMEAAIAQWVQRSKADMAARYAQMGQGNSSALQGEYEKIDQMALSMRGQLLQGEEALGGRLLQTGVSATGAGTQTAQNQERLLADLIASANQQLGQLGGRAA